MDTTTPTFASIGIDIGKEVFHVVGFGVDGKIVFRRKIKRLELTETFGKLPPCVIGPAASPAGIVCKDYTAAPGEAAHGHHYTASGLDRHRHRQGSLSHRRLQH